MKGRWLRGSAIGCALWALGAGPTDTDAGPAGGGSGAPRPAPQRTPRPPTQAEEDELSLLFSQTEVTTASKAPEPAALAPASITVITADEIRRSGARDITDVLRTVVGIELTRDQFGAMQFVSRGLLSPSESNQILFLIDGVPANIPYYGGASLVYDDMALAGVKRIEVVRGPGSALYGASAFAGVIQVITREGDEIDGVEASGGGGSYPAFHASLVAGTKLPKDASLSLRADVLSSQGPKIRVLEDAFTGIDDANGDPISGAPGNVPTFKDKIHVGGRARFGSVSITGSFLRNTRGVWLGNYVNVSDTQEYEQIDAYERIAWNESFLDGRLKVQTALIAQQHNERETQQVYPQARFDVDDERAPWPGDYEDYSSEKALDIGDLASNSFSSETQVSYEVFKRNILLAGVQYHTINQTDTYFYENWDENGISPTRIDLPFNTAVTRQIIGGYLNDDWTIVGDLPGLYRVRVLAGLRYDYYDDDIAKKEDFGRGPFFDAFAPRAGLVYEAFRGVYLKYLYGRAFRAPSFRELYSDDPNVVVGRPTLVPETIDFHEVSAGVARPRFQIQATAFSGKGQDLLVSRNNGTTIEFGNLGESSTRGIEAEVRVELLPGSMVFANATVQEARIDDIDQDSPGVTQVKGTAGTSLSLGRRFLFYLSGTYMGKRLQPDFLEELEEERYVDPYIFVNSSATFRTPLEGVELQVTGVNLLDAEIRDPFDGGALPDEIPGEGRSFWGEVRIRF